MTPDFRDGIQFAFERMRSMVKWRMNRCLDQGELSNRIVIRVESMLEEAERLISQGMYSEAVAKLTNAAIYLGRYMYVE